MVLRLWLVFLLVVLFRFLVWLCFCLLILLGMILVWCFVACYCCCLLCLGVCVNGCVYGLGGDRRFWLLALFCLFYVWYGLVRSLLLPGCVPLC